MLYIKECLDYSKLVNDLVVQMKIFTAQCSQTSICCAYIS